MKVTRGESGQATIYIVLFLGTLMCLLLALAVDVGNLFHQRRMAQAAADAAALAAVEEVASGNSLSSGAVINAANVAATANGFNTGAATNPAVVTLASLSSGNYPSTAATPPANWVQANVQMPVKTFFLGGISGLSTMTVSATAIAAGGVPSHTCTCLLGATGNDLNLSGTGDLNMKSCGATINSSSSNAIVMSGSSQICGTSVQAVSPNWNNTGNIPGNVTICPAATRVQGAGACSAPSIVTPTMPAGLTCGANPIQGYILGPNALYPSQSYGGNYMLPMKGAVKSASPTNTPIPDDDVVSNSVCYTSLDMSNASSVTFQSGITYFVQGTFLVGSGEAITGTNVQFVLTTSGAITFNGAATAQLSAPNASDGNPGVLFYIPNGPTFNIGAGANPTLNGILYAPLSNITLDGGTTTNLDMDIVANTLTMGGSAALNNYATSLINGSSGGGGVGVPVLVQ
jgi:Flp pilus assembly protein TadG